MVSSRPAAEFHPVMQISSRSMRKDTRLECLGSDVSGTGLRVCWQPSG